MDEKVDLLQIKIDQAREKLPEETLSAISAVDWQGAIFSLREKKGYSFEQLGDLEIETELLLSGLLNPADYPKELERRMGISKAQVNELVHEMNDLVFNKIREELIKNTERKKILKKNEKTFQPKMQVPVAPPTQMPQSDRDILSSHGIEIIDSPVAGEKPKETLPTPDLPAVPSVQLMPARNDSRSDSGRQAGKLELEGEVPPVRSRPLEQESATVTLGRPASNGIHPILAQKLSGYVQNETVETQHSLDNITKKTNGGVKSAPQSGLAPKLVSYPPKGDPYRMPPE